MIFGILAWTISLQHPFKKPPDEKQRHKVRALIDALNSHSNMLDNGKIKSGNSIEMWAEAYLLNWIHS